MGIFTDAFQKHSNKKSVTANRIPVGQPVKLVEKQPESAVLRELIRKGDFDANLLVLSAADSLDAENFRNLRAQILFPKDCERRRVIMVTSSLPDEGKTFVASNLAVSIALGIHEHVLLVDCDLRRPSIHKVFGCLNSSGLYEQLTGKMELKDLIIRTKIDKLSVLPAGAQTPNPSELLSSEVMKKTLHELKTRYDDRFIIIDSTPSQIASEANVLANYVDGIIFVVMAQTTNRELIQTSIDALGRDKIIGIIFNGYKKSYGKPNRYYKKYYKGYYKRYGTS